MLASSQLETAGHHASRLNRQHNFGTVYKAVEIEIFESFQYRDASSILPELHVILAGMGYGARIGKAKSDLVWEFDVKLVVPYNGEPRLRILILDHVVRPPRTLGFRDINLLTSAVKWRGDLQLLGKTGEICKLKMRYNKLEKRPAQISSPIDRQPLLGIPTATPSCTEDKSIGEEKPSLNVEAMQSHNAASIIVTLCRLEAISEAVNAVAIKVDTDQSRSLNTRFLTLSDPTTIIFGDVLVFPYNNTKFVKFTMLDSNKGDAVIVGQNYLDLDCHIPNDKMISLPILNIEDEEIAVAKFYFDFDQKVVKNLSTQVSTIPARSSSSSSQTSDATSAGLDIIEGANTSHIKTLRVNILEIKTMIGRQTRFIIKGRVGAQWLQTSPISDTTLHEAFVFPYATQKNVSFRIFADGSFEDGPLSNGKLNLETFVQNLMQGNEVLVGMLNESNDLSHQLRVSLDAIKLTTPLAFAERYSGDHVTPYSFFDVAAREPSKWLVPIPASKSIQFTPISLRNPISNQYLVVEYAGVVYKTPLGLGIRPANSRYPLYQTLYLQLFEEISHIRLGLFEHKPLNQSDTLVSFAYLDLNSNLGQTQRVSLIIEPSGEINNDLEYEFKWTEAVSRSFMWTDPDSVKVSDKGHQVKYFEVAIIQVRGVRNGISRLRSKLANQERRKLEVYCKLTSGHIKLQGAAGEQAPDRLREYLFYDQFSFPKGSESINIVVYSRNENRDTLLGRCEVELRPFLNHPDTSNRLTMPMFDAKYEPAGSIVLSIKAVTASENPSPPTDGSVTRWKKPGTSLPQTPRDFKVARVEILDAWSLKDRRLDNLGTPFVVVHYRNLLLKSQEAGVVAGDSRFQFRQALEFQYDVKSRVQAFIMTENNGHDYILGCVTIEEGSGTAGIHDLVLDNQKVGQIRCHINIRTATIDEEAEANQGLAAIKPKIVSIDTAEVVGTKYFGRTMSFIVSCLEIRGLSWIADSYYLICTYGEDDLKSPLLKQSKMTSGFRFPRDRRLHSVRIQLMSRNMVLRDTLIGSGLISIEKFVPMVCYRTPYTLGLFDARGKSVGTLLTELTTSSSEIDIAHNTIHQQGELPDALPFEDLVQQTSAVRHGNIPPSLRITVHKVENLPTMRDPYVQVSFGQESLQGTVMKGCGSNVAIGHEFLYPYSPKKFAGIEIYDKGRILASDILLGRQVVDVDAHLTEPSIQKIKLLTIDGAEIDAAAVYVSVCASEETVSKGIATLAGEEAIKQALRKLQGGEPEDLQLKLPRPKTASSIESLSVASKEPQALESKEPSDDTVRADRSIRVDLKDFENILAITKPYFEVTLGKNSLRGENINSDRFQSSFMFPSDGGNQNLRVRLYEDIRMRTDTLWGSLKVDLVSFDSPRRVNLRHSDGRLAGSVLIQIKRTTWEILKSQVIPGSAPYFSNIDFKSRMLSATDNKSIKVVLGELKTSMMQNTRAYLLAKIGTGADLRTTEIDWDATEECAVFENTLYFPLKGQRLLVFQVKENRLRQALIDSNLLWGVLDIDAVLGEGPKSNADVPMYDTQGTDKGILSVVAEFFKTAIDAPYILNNAPWAEVSTSSPSVKCRSTWSGRRVGTLKIELVEVKGLENASNSTYMELIYGKEKISSPSTTDFSNNIFFLPYVPLKYVKMILREDARRLLVDPELGSGYFDLDQGLLTSGTIHQMSLSEKIRVFFKIYDFPAPADSAYMLTPTVVDDTASSTDVEEDRSDLTEREATSPHNPGSLSVEILEIEKFDPHHKPVIVCGNNKLKPAGIASWHEILIFPYNSETNIVIKFRERGRNVSQTQTINLDQFPKSVGLPIMHSKQKSQQIGFVRLKITHDPNTVPSKPVILSASRKPEISNFQLFEVVTIQILGAENLGGPNVSPIDPCITLSYNGSLLKSPVYKNGGKNPQFYYEFLFPISEKQSKIYVELFDDQKKISAVGVDLKDISYSKLIRLEFPDDNGTIYAHVQLSRPKHDDGFTDNQAQSRRIQPKFNQAYQVKINAMSKTPYTTSYISLATKTQGVLINSPPFKENFTPLTFWIPTDQNAMIVDMVEQESEARIASGSLDFNNSHKEVSLELKDPENPDHVVNTLKFIVCSLPENSPVYLPSIKEPAGAQPYRPNSSFTEKEDPPSCTHQEEILPFKTKFKSVQIKVHSAANLVNPKTILGRMDPYVRMTLREFKLDSEVATNAGVNPKFSTTFVFPYDGQRRLHFDVFDCDHVFGQFDKISGWGSVDLLKHRDALSSNGLIPRITIQLSTKKPSQVRPTLDVTVELKTERTGVPYLIPKKH